MNNLKHYKITLYYKLSNYFFDKAEDLEWKGQ